MATRWHAATDAAAQVQALATSIASTLAHVIEDQGTACLAVSGGRSPIALFAALRVLPLRWADVSITL
ncbi:MAG: 6-phosphogluconolactonase, partial [Ralstonia mannitolilytica]